MKQLICIIKNIAIYFLLFISWAYANDFEVPSTFNPVGSGARAIGMGGAFIAVADDATSASWNPGGLIQLKRPEFSIVTSFSHRKEKNIFELNPESNGKHDISEVDINYFSAAYPFEFLNRNMIIALSFQRLFDFGRDWNFVLNGKGAYLSYSDQWDFQQEGGLSALGISYCARIIPRKLSIGFTLNFWNDDLSQNRWKQTYQIDRTAMLGSSPYTLDYYKTKEYTFSGFNANLGFLWNINEKLTVGAVLKTPFTADIDYEEYERRIEDYPAYPSANQDYDLSYSEKNELKMPMSYGIGFIYRFLPYFYLSGDIYKTEWDDFVYKNEEGIETSPVTGLPIKESKTEPTYQVRLGAEYLFLNKNRGYIIPLRCGIFYDPAPAPAENSPDNYYGFSLGAGFTKNKMFSFDIAFQYRYGNDVGASLFQGIDFSQNVEEHKVYTSIIFYWHKPFKKKFLNY